MTRFVCRSGLAEDLVALGVSPGDTLLVHASLRSLGHVVGGTTAVVGALLDAVGPGGTLVAPAYTPENRDPSRWIDPAVPVELWPLIRASIPAFEPALTPSAGVGAVAERIRTWPGAVRGAHPQTSFAAIGPRAEKLMADHVLASPLGQRSPLARLERAGASALLLGVGFDRCTAFHLAEYRLPDPPKRTHGCAVITASGRRWITFESVALDANDFLEVGAALSTSRAMPAGQVGAAGAALVPIAMAVAFAFDWFRAHRR
jgi:aminoglycoside 3-N-acetyltransferase